VEEVVEVVLIFVIVEMAAVFADLAGFVIARWFENESWLEEDLASVLVDLLEPVPQVLVLLRVVIQPIDRALGVVHAFAVGEPFEKRPQLPGRLTKGGFLDMNVINGCERGARGSTLAPATSLEWEWAFLTVCLPSIE